MHADIVLTADAADQQSSRNVSRMCGFIADNFLDDIDSNDIAAAADIHPKYAMSLFKKSTGMTMNEYVSLLRLSYAQARLLEEDANILNVAMESGFGSLSAFNKSFRKIAGMSPSDFRRERMTGSSSVCPAIVRRSLARGDAVGDHEMSSHHYQPNRQQRFVVQSGSRWQGAVHGAEPAWPTSTHRPGIGVAAIREHLRGARLCLAEGSPARADVLDFRGWVFSHLAETGLIEPGSDPSLGLRPDGPFDRKRPTAG